MGRVALSLLSRDRRQLTGFLPLSSVLCPVDTSPPRWIRLPDDRLLAVPSAVGWIRPRRSAFSFVGRVLLLVSHTNCFLAGCRTPWPCNAAHDIISRPSRSAGSWRSLSAFIGLATCISPCVYPASRVDSAYYSSGICSISSHDSAGHFRCFSLIGLFSPLHPSGCHSGESGPRH